MTILGTILTIAAMVTSSISVCSQGCDFTALKPAIDAAQEGDTVVIKKGTYPQLESIVIARPMTVLGEGRPIISGNGHADVLVVKAPRVKIEGLQITGAGNSFLHELAGVRVEETEDCTIINNDLSGGAYGVYLANTARCLVSENHLTGGFENESEAGNGIHSWQGKEVTITANTITGHRDGIYLEFTNDSYISKNTVSQNLRYGLHFMTSHRNLYQLNRFEENGAGVAVMYSRQVTMTENIFTNNRGMASYGLLLKDISVGKIERNVFKDNTFGIYMEGTNRSKFIQNRFEDNGVGLRILGNCDDNLFQTNNFLGNTFAVTTNSSRNPNQFNGNYWSQYDGYDLNGDERGDIPFHPVSLSSILVERFDTTYVLMKSPLFSILDVVEQAFPMLIPESLVDPAPLMRPWRD